MVHPDWFRLFPIPHRDVDSCLHFKIQCWEAKELTYLLLLWIEFFLLGIHIFLGVLELLMGNESICSGVKGFCINLPFL